MGGATLVWHGLWPSSLLGPKTLTPLLKFDKYSHVTTYSVGLQATEFHFTVRSQPESAIVRPKVCTRTLCKLWRLLRPKYKWWSCRLHPQPEFIIYGVQTPTRATVPIVAATLA